MDVSKNRGTPKWIIYNGKPYIQIYDLEVFPIFLVQHPYLQCVEKPKSAILWQLQNPNTHRDLKDTTTNTENNSPRNMFFHTLHGTNGIFTYMNAWLFFMENVGKYTTNIPVPWILWV